MSARSRSLSNRPRVLPPPIQPPAIDPKPFEAFAKSIADEMSRELLTLLGSQERGAGADVISRTKTVLIAIASGGSAFWVADADCFVLGVSAGTANANVKLNAAPTTGVTAGVTNELVAIGARCTQPFTGMKYPVPAGTKVYMASSTADSVMLIIGYIDPRGSSIIATS